MSTATKLQEILNLLEDWGHSGVVLDDEDEIAIEEVHNCVSRNLRELRRRRKFRSASVDRVVSKFTQKSG